LNGKLWWKSLNFATLIGDFFSQSLNKMWLVQSP
jgi:hypothetical protein